MPNPVVHWQIITPEPGPVAAFYQKLFSWTVSQDNALGYRMVATGSEEGIDGGIWPAPPGKPTFVQLHVSVEDIDAMVNRATALGASVIIPKSVLPGGDAICILQDPAGLSFVLCQPRRG